MATKIRMWKWVRDDFGRSCIEGVVQGPPPGTPEGACCQRVDLTIRTSAVRRKLGERKFLMANGDLYELDGPSRQQMIQIACRA